MYATSASRSDFGSDEYLAGIGGFRAALVLVVMAPGSTIHWRISSAESFVPTEFKALAAAGIGLAVDGIVDVTTVAAAAARTFKLSTVGEFSDLVQLPLVRLRHGRLALEGDLDHIVNRGCCA
jgi:hypothetical protein